ncbi:hypothetical protein AAFN85_03355 [Mucilaginibacter sp. CAU 1740]|uniref:hypothetical protein n=1 Tax=Mucilaginibacter sp. CAU 1740 TaxID=3140365 RepID=UPI00325B76DE
MKNQIDIVAKIENLVLPMYYDHPDKWLSVVKRAAADVMPVFESGRTAGSMKKTIYP